MTRVILLCWIHVTVCLPLSLSFAMKPLRTTIGLTDAEKLQIVTFHNNIRKQRYSSDMRYMTWDGELAWIAESYGLRCRFRPNKVKIHSKFTRFGENMYAVSYSKSFTISQAIEAWYVEMQNFQYRANMCRAGKLCANYTQMAWSQTYKVGCAITHCQFISDVAIRNGLLFICNYGPRGNLLDDDGKAMLPYERGHACTRCNEGDYCRNKLCANAQRDLILSPNDFSESDNVPDSVGPKRKAVDRPVCCAFIDGGSTLSVYHAIIAVLSVLLICLVIFILVYRFRRSFRCEVLTSFLNRSSSSEVKDEHPESDVPEESDPSKTNVGLPLLDAVNHDANQNEGEHTEYSLPFDAIHEESSATESVADHEETEAEPAEGEKVLKKRPLRISLPRPAHPAPRSPPPLFPAPVLDKFR